MSNRLDSGWSVDGLGVRVGGGSSLSLDLIASRLRAFPRVHGAFDVSMNIDEVADPALELPPPAGASRRLFEPEYPIDYYPTHQVLYLADDGVASTAHLSTGRVRTVVRRHDERAAHTASHLFFTLPLLEMLKRHGRFALHAGAVAIDGRAVLIVGASGAGKSTLALACALDGWDFLGDDVVLMRAGEPGVSGFPDEIDLTAQSIAFFPELATIDRVSGRDWSKRAISPLDIPGLRVVAGAVPAAMVFPERGPDDVVALDPDDVLERLVPNVVRTDVRGAKAHLGVLADLARRVPAYRIATDNPAAAPAILRRRALDVA